MPVPPVVLLGPQRLSPTLNRAVEELGVRGPVAAVTAGWEEREGEDQELSDHLGRPVLNLAVYHRVEEIFRRDPELFAAMRARHDTLRRLQELYRLRLGGAMEAARELLRREDDPGLLEPEREAAIQAVRALDEHHLARVGEVHARFEAELRPGEREHVARHRSDLAHILSSVAALCIAGGHVAILLNRLRLLDVLRLAEGRPVFAWSAGAMAVSERVVLFHDSPPQGPGHAELLERGLCAARGVVPLPHAQKRLRLGDPTRVAALARRLAPAVCVTLDPRTRLEIGPDGWRAAPGTFRLAGDGSLVDLGAAEEAGAR